jgi:hypothetical protein
LFQPIGDMLDRPGRQDIAQTKSMVMLQLSYSEDFFHAVVAGVAGLSWRRLLSLAVSEVVAAVAV